jgi:hypothetical protein
MEYLIITNNNVVSCFHSFILPLFQWIRRPFVCVFSLIKNYFKYVKIIGIKLTSLESIFLYESDNTNYVQYNQVCVAQLFWSKFILECMCVLFIETDVVFWSSNSSDLCQQFTKLVFLFNVLVETIVSKTKSVR